MQRSNHLSSFGVNLTQVVSVKLDNDNFLLWTAVKERNGVQKRSKITFLTGKLQKSRKRTMSIDQYLNKVKLLADNLKIASKAIPHSKLRF